LASLLAVLICSYAAEENYALADPANEKKFGFKLSEALIRAKSSNGRLFSKKVFYVTPKVPVDIKLLRNVVTACGGQVIILSTLHVWLLSLPLQVLTQTPTIRILDANSDRHIISCLADSSIWRPVASKHNVYSQELILTSALKQHVDWTDESFLVPGSF
jgi:mediator of DNA damage checkpoint protein 1